VHEVRARVHAQFGVLLEPEVKFAGPFAAATAVGTA
jgi:UDP-N-acetylenolpyruvoylglucosamine reductase